MFTFCHIKLETFDSIAKKNVPLVIMSSNVRRLIEDKYFFILLPPPNLMPQRTHQLLAYVYLILLMIIFLNKMDLEFF